MGTLYTTAVLLATVGLNPPEDVATDDVSLVEINHCYDQNGHLAFEQLIFYDWCEKRCRYEIRAWRLLKSANQLPKRNWRQGRYQVIWHDQGVLRSVRAKSLRETWTQYDPELEHRNRTPSHRRRELRNLRIVTTAP